MAIQISRKEVSIIFFGKDAIMGFGLKSYRMLAWGVESHGEHATGFI